MQRFAENELERRVDEVLFYVWDPIGVNNDPFARGEYSSYVSEILSYLQNNKTESEIAERLCSITVDFMGFPSSKDSALEVAKLLIEHKLAIAEGLA